MATRLEKLLQKEAQLKAQIQQAKAAERTLEKKRDTRRKILIGAAVMARVESGKWPEADLLEMMDGFLSRQNERDLFGLDGDEDGAGDRQSEKKRSTKQYSSKQPARKTTAKKKAEAKAKKLPEPADDLASEFNL